MPDPALNRGDLTALLPLIVLGGTAVAALLSIALRPSEGRTAAICGAGLLAAFAALFAADGAGWRTVTPLLVIDGFSLYFAGLAIAAALGVLALARGYWSVRDERADEFHLLLVLATLGAVTLVASRHFAAFLLGLEVLSVSLFALAAYARHRPLAVEAGIKYLVLAGVGVSFLLFGAALVYARLGTLAFPEIGARLAGLESPGLAAHPFVSAGLAMILVGVGFKLSLAPFHMWAADVYQGAPAPASAFLATVSKAPVAALLLRYVAESGALGSASATAALGTLAVLSILAGNLLALMQSDVKRLLAYSSIAHMGYLAVAVAATGPLAAEAAAYYVGAYTAMTLGAFAVVVRLSSATGGGEAADFAHYRGLAHRHPGLAVALALMLLSLAGIPVSVGFVGKVYLVAAGVEGGLWVPVAALVAGSVLGLFYYLRLMLLLFARPRPEAAAGIRAPVGGPAAQNAVVALLAVTVVWLGLQPEPFLALVRGLLLGP